MSVGMNSRARVAILGRWMPYLELVETEQLRGQRNVVGDRTYWLHDGSEGEGEGGRDVVIAPMGSMSGSACRI